MVNIALRAARQAGDMIVKAADNLELVKVDEKGRHDFVTEADRRSEETSSNKLRKPIQTIAFSRESGASGESSSDIEWIIDPLMEPLTSLEISCRDLHRL